MAVKFHSSGDAILSYCIVFSMYITLWSTERQSDALLLALYYSDFFYIAQYVCVKLNKAWQELNSEISRPSIDSIEGDISLKESLPFFTTPISLLPFHVVFKIGLDRGYFYQFVCFLRLVSLYQEGRIQVKWEETHISLEDSDTEQLTKSSPSSSQVISPCEMTVMQDYQPSSSQVKSPYEMTVMQDYQECQCQCIITKQRIGG